MSAADEVAGSLNGQWRNPRAVRDALGCWSVGRVRQVLGEMAKAGAAETRVVPFKNWTTVEYRIPGGRP
jgi:hypothetical protein